MADEGVFTIIKASGMSQDQTSEYKDYSEGGPVSAWRPVERITLLERGQIVRSRVTGDTYVVDSNYGSHVTAVRTTDITHPAEWEYLDK